MGCHLAVLADELVLASVVVCGAHWRPLEQLAACPIYSCIFPLLVSPVFWELHEAMALVACTDMAEVSGSWAWLQGVWGSAKAQSGKPIWLHNSLEIWLGFFSLDKLIYLLFWKQRKCLPLTFMLYSKIYLLVDEKKNRNSNMSGSRCTGYAYWCLSF